MPLTRFSEYSKALGLLPKLWLRYEITDTHVEIRKGLIWRDVERTKLSTIGSSEVRNSPRNSILGVRDLLVHPRGRDSFTIHQIRGYVVADALLNGEEVEQVSPVESQSQDSEYVEPAPLTPSEEQSDELRLAYRDYLEEKGNGDHKGAMHFGRKVEEMRTLLREFVEPQPITEREKSYFPIRHVFKMYNDSKDPVDRARLAPEIAKARDGFAAGIKDTRGDNPELHYPESIPKAKNHLLSEELKSWGGIDYAYSSYLHARESLASEITRTHTESGVEYLTEIVQRNIVTLDTIAQRYLAGELEEKPPANLGSLDEASEESAATDVSPEEPPRSGSLTAQEQEALDLLNLEWPCDPKEVRAKHLRLVERVHESRVDEVNRAYEIVMKLLAD